MEDYSDRSGPPQVNCQRLHRSATIEKPHDSKVWRTLTHSPTLQPAVQPHQGCLARARRRNREAAPPPGNQGQGNHGVGACSSRAGQETSCPLPPWAKSLRDARGFNRAQDRRGWALLGASFCLFALHSVSRTAVRLQRILSGALFLACVFTPCWGFFFCDDVLMRDPASATKIRIIQELSKTKISTLEVLDAFEYV